MRRKSGGKKSLPKQESPKPQRRSTRSSRRLNKSPSPEKESEAETNSSTNPENSQEISDVIEDQTNVNVESSENDANSNSDNLVVEKTEDISLNEEVNVDHQEDRIEDNDNAKGKSKGIVNTNDDQSWNNVESQIENDNVQGTAQSPSNNNADIIENDEKISDTQINNEEDKQEEVVVQQEKVVEENEEVQKQQEQQQESFESEYAVEKIEQNNDKINNEEIVDNSETKDSKILSNSDSENQEESVEEKCNEKKRITLRRSSLSEKEKQEEEQGQQQQEKEEEQKIESSENESFSKNVFNEQTTRDESSSKLAEEKEKSLSPPPSLAHVSESYVPEKKIHRLSSLIDVKEVQSGDDDEDKLLPLRKVILHRHGRKETEEHSRPNRPNTWLSSGWLRHLSQSLYKVDVGTIKLVCPSVEFLKDHEVTLETSSRERTKSESDHIKRKSSYEHSDEEHEKMEDSSNENQNKNIISMNRKISIVDDAGGSLKAPPSPAKNPKSEVLFITNLVRPYTVKQLKELLERTGTIVGDGFWTDRIKSKCYVHYVTADEAEATRNALHGIYWPPGNGKQLVIDYATVEDLEKAKNPPLPIPPVSTEKVPEKENKEPEVFNKDTFLERKHEERRRRSSERDRDFEMAKEEMRHRRRSRSKSRERVRKHSRRSYTPETQVPKKLKKEEPVPQKLMDDLFLKTKATPSVYWQPLSPEEIATKQKQRLVRMEEHKRRIEDRERRMRGTRRPPFRRR